MNVFKYRRKKRAPIHERNVFCFACLICSRMCFAVFVQMDACAVCQEKLFSHPSVEVVESLFNLNMSLSEWVQAGLCNYFEDHNEMNLNVMAMSTDHISIVEVY